ncbi:two-component sensor histidine kinase [Proteiniborus sp. DW1]|uniref:sensor histidine kinase n=1 Tax=Proteiniborus sp. DW1 TaxID=1889883 RepID=UPI00092E09A3|nr:HAMP domain-containing sensor histidine kinase [Proteiniborus sp. DW1]SCG82869.1 two-component sensor histidine kinase [Proteiniborus sp. DW1]
MSSFTKNILYKIILLGFVFLLSFFISIGIYNIYEKILFEKLATVIGVITENSKDIEIKTMAQLKSENSQYTSVGKESLKKYGYNDSSFIFVKSKYKVVYIGLLFSIIITLLLYISMYTSRKNKIKNIEKLKDYLERINKGDYSLNFQIDDDFSILSDELYKTIIALRELKEKAVQDKIALKDNIADISHQLKTPITSINIMSELMENSDSKEESMEYIQRLKKQILRLEALTNSLLTMSKLDAGAIELKKENIDIKNTIYLAVEPIISLIGKKNIALNIEGKGVQIKGDAYWLSEAFLNIIKNSVEHLKVNGQINIFIQSNPIFTEVRIEDNGSGFLANELPYIFKRFFKGKNASKDSIGIGLSMARTIIEQHNGEIIAENIKEGGARFRVKFYKIL